MAAILPKRISRGHSQSPINQWHEIDGRRFRICTTSDGRILCIGAKGKKGERLLEFDSRLFLKVARTSGLRLRWWRKRDNKMMETKP